MSGRIELVLVTLFLSTLAACATGGDTCFRDHLEEAINLNEARREYYASLAAADRPEHDLSAQSEAVSDMLIDGENKALLASRLPTRVWSTTVGACCGSGTRFTTATSTI